MIEVRAIFDDRGTGSAKTRRIFLRGGANRIFNDIGANQIFNVRGGILILLPR